MPAQAYALAVLVTITDNYDMVFDPSFYVTLIPRYQLLNKDPQCSMLEQYSMFGVNSACLDVNVTAFNLDGAQFFEAQLSFDTLAEQKFQIYRVYDPALKTSEVTVNISAHLVVDFENQTDIDKLFQSEWELALP